MNSSKIAIHRHPDAEAYPEIKDPSIVRMRDGRFMMYATIGGGEGGLGTGRFIADDIAGPWTELAPVRFLDAGDAQICAPAIDLAYDASGRVQWRMYVQTGFDRPDSVIVLATSEDGETFTVQPEPVGTKHSVTDAPAPLEAVYDAGFSRLTVDGQEMECLTYSGYRRIGSGDIYASFRPAGSSEPWPPAKLVLKQEDVTFHNPPGCDHYEWGLEGAKIEALGDGLYLLTGVCFLNDDKAPHGTRQRVFFAVSREPDGPYVPLGPVIDPAVFPEGQGENGHPDTYIADGVMHLIYQARDGDGQPWHLRHTSLELAQLREMAEECLAGAEHAPATTAERIGAIRHLLSPPSAGQAASP